MAPRDENLNVTITAQNQTGPGLDAAAAGFNRFSGTVAQIGKAIGSVFGVSIGAALVIDQLKKTVDAAIEADETIVHLASAIEATGETAETVAPQLEGYIDAVDRASRFDDEGIRRGLTTLIQMGGKAAESESLLAATADLAAAKHLTFEAAAQLVGKALGGQATALQKSGVFMSESTKKAIELGTESERAALLASLLGEKFGDAAQKDLSTYAARVAEVKNEISNLREAFGKDLLEGIDKATLGLFEFGERAAAVVTAFREGGLFEGWREFALGELYEFGQEMDARERKATAAAGGKKPDVMTPEERDKEEKRLLLIEKNKKALEESAKAAAKFREEIDKLLNRGPGWTRELEVFNTAIDELSESMGREAAIKAFGPDLARISEQARKTASSLGVLTDEAREFTAIKFEENAKAMRKGIEDLLKAMPEGNFPKMLLTVSPAALAELKSALNKARNEYKGFLDDAERDFASMQLEAEIELQIHTLQEPLGDIFSDIFITGGENFSSILKKTLEESAVGMGATLTDAFTVALGAITGEGTRIDSQTGRPVLETGSTAGRAARGLLLGAGAGAQMFAQAQTEKEITSKDIAHAIGQVWVTAGSVTGAIIGTVVTAVTSYLAINKQQSDYMYGIPHVEDGRFTFTDTKNIVDEKVLQIQARGQAILGDVVGGFADIFISLGEIVPNIFREFEWDDRIQREASAHFLEHLDQFFSGTLPRELADMFRPHLEDAFLMIGDDFGATAEAFEGIWESLGRLDPKKAMDLWKSLFVALDGLDEAFDRFGPQYKRDLSPRRPSDDVLLDSRGYGIRGQIAREDEKPWVDTLIEFDERMFNMAESLEALPLDRQIETLAQLAQMSEERYQMETEYVRQINSLLEESNRDIDARQRGYQLRGIEEPEAKIDFLEDYLAGLQEQLVGATDLEEAGRLRGEILSTIDMIADIGQELDPEAFNQWAIDALEVTRELFSDKMVEFTDAIDEQNRNWTDSVQPLIATWMKSFEDVGTSTANLGPAFDKIRDGANEGADALREMAAFAREATAALAALSNQASEDDFVADTVAGRSSG